jgi:hypothetical protein
MTTTPAARIDMDFRVARADSALCAATLQVSVPPYGAYIVHARTGGHNGRGEIGRRTRAQRCTGCSPRPPFVSRPGGPISGRPTLLAQMYGARRVRGTRVRASIRGTLGLELLAVLSRCARAGLLYRSQRGPEVAQTGDATPDDGRRGDEGPALARSAGRQRESLLRSRCGRRAKGVPWAPYPRHERGSTVRGCRSRSGWSW